MIKEDLLLETINRVGVREIEEMSKTDDRFLSLKLNDGELVLLRINTPEREKFYEKVMRKVKVGNN